MAMKRGIKINDKVVISEELSDLLLCEILSHQAIKVCEEIAIEIDEKAIRHLEK